MPIKGKPGFRRRFSNSSRTKNKISEVGYKLYVSEEAMHSIEQAGSYDRMMINQKIQSLASMPRPEDAGKRINGIDAYRVAVGHYRVDYMVYSGKVTIAEVSLDPVNAEKVKHEVPGLYLVTKDSTTFSWSMPKLVPKVTTRHAAVNGMQNHRNRASGLMPEHVEHAFGEEVMELTIFHNPTIGLLGDLWESTRDKFAITTPVAKQLSYILYDIQQKGKPVDWLAHSQGGAIFSQAVNHHNKTRGTSLDFNRVQFHGAATNEWYTARILRKAGVKKLGPDNNQPYDFVPTIVGLNTVNPVRIVGAILISPALSDSGPMKYLKSPHTKPNKRESWKFWQWEN